MRSEADLEARLAALTLEQKVRLLTGADIWALHAEPAIGLRRVVTSDGPAGVRGEAWDERRPSANVPSPTALAASWDEAGVERVGRLLAAEARGKGVDVLLAPTVNLHRTPYGGRHFECLSEDPLLTARIGAAFVRGVQAGGVGATVKHFVANDSETDRFTVDVIADERTLRELYLAPFEAIVREARPWAVMAAYSAVGGTTMTEHPLLRDVLKGEWGFDGVVMSDWSAARSLDAAGEGLLDLVMPGPVGPWGDALVAAVRAGDVPERAIDDKVLRLLRLAARVGALDGAPPAAPPAAGEAAGAASERAGPPGEAAGPPGEAAGPPGEAAGPPGEAAGLLRRAAAAGFVLARNEGAVLPLDAGRLWRVAVLGPNAAVARTLGGGSATVFPPYVVSPLDGLRAALGDGAEVAHATGARAGDRVPAAPLALLHAPGDAGPGVEVRFFGAGGAELGREHRRAASFLWWGPILPGVDAADVERVEIHAILRVPHDGTYAVGASGVGALALSLDGETVLDARLAPPGGDVVDALMRPPQAHVPVELAAGRDVAVVLSHAQGTAGALGGAAPAMVTCRLDVAPQVDDAEELERAVALAAEADVAVVVVGTTEEVESEGFDRTDLALPGRQDELVRRVAAANPRTVAVVNAGAPVLLPWAEDVAAVLLAWFPGQEFGHALADVLLGATEPGGRLPTTWPMEGDPHPAVEPVDGRLRYDEGLLIGHRAYDRAGRTPRYPFGHGLGYADWSYEAISAPAAVAPGRDVAVTVTVRNTGARAGREVVQVYAARPGDAAERPPRRLAGFATVDAGPGETAQAEVAIPARALQRWDASAGWTTAPGAVRLEAGRSSADLRVSATVAIPPAPPAQPA